MTVSLDGSHILTRSALHEDLSAALGFPVWYGHNLDALYDCLTDLSQPTRLEIRDLGALEENLGLYAQRLVTVLDRAAWENPRFSWQPIAPEPEGPEQI